MAAQQLPPEQVDAMLWAGAARGGWRVVPQSLNARGQHKWLYLAPCQAATPPARSPPDLPP